MRLECGGSPCVEEFELEFELGLAPCSYTYYRVEEMKWQSQETEYFCVTLSWLSRRSCLHTPATRAAFQSANVDRV